MQFFLDSANPEEVKQAFSTGLVAGVTTNPTLAAQNDSKYDYKKAILEIAKVVNGPISVEVLSTEFEKMVLEGRKIARLDKNIVVKIPTTLDGIKACQVLVSEGIRTNMTLVFSATQALLCAKAGATYVSPFVGRVNDGGYDGMGLIGEIHTIFENYQFQTKILVASVRGANHIGEAAQYGADVVTIPTKVFWKMFEHPLTSVGLDKFLKDFKSSGLKHVV